MSKLFSPLSIKGVGLKNRIAMAPMCQYSSLDGMVNDWHLVHYGTRAAGGAGLIIVEATAVSPEGRISPADLGIWSDNHINGLKKITGFIHNQGSEAGIQIGHAGRKASTHVPWKGSGQVKINEGGWQTLAPSAVPFTAADIIPEALSEEGILNVISSFRSAARRAFVSGFRVLEIHAAHGYLIFQFLSPISNKRTDQYGGSFENRTRLLNEIVTAVKQEWPAENPLFVRISSTEWTEGGWSIDDTVKLAIVLKKLGVDLIDCSSGGNVENVKIPLGPGYQVGFSEAVRKTGIMSGAVGLITTPMQAENILLEEKAEIIFFGRELLRNPYFAYYAARDLDENVSMPSQYLRAKIQK